MISNAVSDAARRSLICRAESVDEITEVIEQQEPSRLKRSDTHPVRRRQQGIPLVDVPAGSLRDPDIPLPMISQGRSPVPMGHTRRRVANVLTVDLEDWPVAVLGPHHDITSRVVTNTKEVLRILRWHNARATFFVLTRAAEHFPDLIRMVRDDGHEIASHGHGHELVTRMTPEAFERDVARSVEVIENITGERPIGYRAPAFSIVKETRWAGDILERLGFRYDSSVFPIRHPRYGIADAPRGIHPWPSGRLIECPPATFRLLGRNLPIAGGGYFRLLPGSVARTCIRAFNRRGYPAILYVHPYELDVEGLREHRRNGVRFGPWRHITQGLFRARIERRLHRLFESFDFVTMRELLTERERGSTPRSATTLNQCR